MQTKRVRLLRRLALCLSCNVFLVCFLVGLVYKFADEDSSYFRFGPSSSLRIAGVSVDTWSRYACLHGLLLVTQALDMLVSEFANPILCFNIYNPDKEIITEFTHLELQFFAQSLWLINGVRAALILMVTISQFDIAVAKVVYTELTGLFTVYFLLSEKKFVMAEEDVPLLSSES